MKKFNMFVLLIALFGLSNTLIASGIESIGTFSGYIYGTSFDNEACQGGIIFHMKTDDGDKLGFLYCPNGDEAGQLSDNAAAALNMDWLNHTHIQVATDKYGNVVSIRKI